jgi:superfamily II DNA or RNA helicase
MSQVLEHQIPILEQLAKDRKKGKTLVVLPSGAGKTHVSAFDSKQAKAKSVLYIAHRNEILVQAAGIFKDIHKLTDKQMGFLDQDSKDYDKNFLFATNHTLVKDKSMAKVLDRKWDYVVVDEFHHVPAATYQRILKNLRYKFLLGLTATPFRLDNKDIKQYVDDNISYWIDLEKGIKDGILVPFLYNGLYDNVDYSDIEWLGYKYHENDLNKKLLIDRRDNQIITEFRKFCGDKRTIGFCVTIKHVERITKKFNDSGIPARFITANTPMFERRTIVEDFREGLFQVLFVRDVFNEGVDFPFVEALLFLRPTWSKTVFFQQIGRGLRKMPGKTAVIILDFIGNYHNAFKLSEWLGFAEKSEVSLFHKPTKPVYKHNVAIVHFDKILVDLFEYQRRMSLPVTPEALKEEYFRMKTILGRRPVSSDFTPKGLIKNLKKFGYSPPEIIKQ